MIKTILFLACLLLLSVNAFSAVKTWDGGGADANWSTAANWADDVAPVAGDDLVFPANAAQFSTNNNLFLFASFNSISIEGGNYTIGGNPLRLARGLTVGGGTQMINTAVSLSAAQTFSAAQTAFVTVAVLSLGNFALTIDGDGSYGLGLISGGGAINKNGLGATLIAAASSYSGSINLNGGVLVIDANIPNSAVNVAAATTTGGAFGFSGLGGTGTIGAANIITGTISAGTLTSPTGILTIGGGLNFSGGSDGDFICKIGGTTAGAGGYDQLNVTGGAVGLNNARLVPLPLNFRPAIGDSFKVINNATANPVNGTFLNAPENAIFGGALNTAFRVTYHGGDGNDVVITRVNKARFDFNGDGKSDVSTFNNGRWNIKYSDGNSTAQIVFGTANDKPAPADYDGDNKDDVAVFRDGVWYIFNSATSTFRSVQFGLPEDLPLPNDFDGDGLADIAVYRPSSGTWYELRSLGNQFYGQQFGLPGDIPQLGDFDGDGIGDLAVFRPSSGFWYFYNSADNLFNGFPFGITTDKPVPADYDGDGKTDVAVFREGAQDYFYILNSSDNTFQATAWGISGDVPVSSDYDGDGKADVSVFRPSVNTWYLLESTNGYTPVAFGQSGDVPVPSVFYR